VVQFIELTHLIIGSEKMDVVVKNVEQLYRPLCMEFGWEEIVITEGGKRITTNTVLPGATLIVSEVVQRLRTVRMMFPGEQLHSTGIDGTGAEIQEWIEGQIELKPSQPI
jgi:hypothetical protein